MAATSGDGSRHTLQSGDRLRVDAPAGGVWYYLAVRGGLEVEPVLGSRSTDTLSGLGPPAISAGQELPLGDDPHSELVTDFAPVRRHVHVVRVWPGPRIDWFASGLHALTRRDWIVGSDVSRVGARLSAGRFEHERDDAGADGE